MWKKPRVNTLLRHPIICQKKRSGASSGHQMSFWFVLMEYCWRERGRHRIKAPVSDGSTPGLQSVVIWWGLYLTPSCEIKAAPPESPLCSMGVCSAACRVHRQSCTPVMFNRFTWWKHTICRCKSGSRHFASFLPGLLQKPHPLWQEPSQIQTKSLTLMSSYLEFQPRMKDSKSTIVWLLAQQI